VERKDLVSVFTVTNAAEAEIIRNSLEAAGIPCQIGGETQGGFSGVLRIDILTTAEDADEARRHLRAHKFESKHE
jgi:hypothetical protein